MISFLISSQFFELSDGVIAIGASMQHIFPFPEFLPNCPSRKEPSVPEHRTNLHFQTSNQHLKSTNAFLGGCKDFLFADRTICPDGIEFFHLSHLDLQSLSNKIFRLLDFKVECRF